jgi:hypothetical protein
MSATDFGPNDPAVRALLARVGKLGKRETTKIQSERGRLARRNALAGVAWIEARDTAERSGRLNAYEQAFWAAGEAVTAAARRTGPHVATEADGWLIFTQAVRAAAVAATLSDVMSPIGRDMLESGLRTIWNH